MNLAIFEERDPIALQLYGTRFKILNSCEPLFPVHVGGAKREHPLSRLVSCGALQYAEHLNRGPRTI